VNVKSRNTKLLVAGVHSTEVAINAVHDHALVNCFVGLGSFETLDGVVKCSVLGHKFEWLVLHDLGSLPTSIVVIVIDLQHVIGLQSTKSVSVVGCGLCLKVSGGLDNEVVGHEGLLISRGGVAPTEGA
jgi:hypothetical protein